MKLIDRHIGAAVLSAVAVVVLGFVGLMTMLALVEELRSDSPGYTWVDALQFVALTTPRRAYEALPYMVFLGVLVGLGSLASHSELVVMRAAGVSVYRIFVSVIAPAVLVLVVGMAVGEGLAPWAEERAQAGKTQARQESETIRLYGGYWYKEGNVYLNVDSLTQDGEMVGLRQYVLDDTGRLILTRRAERATYDAPDWTLYKVRETHIGDEASRVVRHDTITWSSRADPRLLAVRVLLEPRKLSVLDLYQQIGHMRREGLDSVSYEIAYYAKLFQPLSVLGLTVLALGFILGPLRQVSMGVRLSVGVLAGLTFKYLQDLFAPMSAVYEWPPVLAVLTPILLCWLVGWWGLRRAA